MLKRHLIAILFLPVFAGAQKQLGMEHYYYTQTQTDIIVPKINYLSPKNWCSEIRYNYEEIQTASFHFGKKLSFKQAPALELIPLAGICFGRLNAGSVGTFIEASFNKFGFSSEPQYVFSFKDNNDNYYYSWSEATYELSSFFYTGLALQHTRAMKEAHIFEPGIIAGFSIKNFDIPIYYFNPLTSDRNFVFGVNWKWQKK